MIRINKNLNDINTKAEIDIDLTNTKQFCEKCHKYVELNNRVFLYEFENPKNNTGVVVRVLCKDCWCEE